MTIRSFMRAGGCAAALALTFVGQGCGGGSDPATEVRSLELVSEDPDGCAVQGLVIVHGIHEGEMCGVEIGIHFFLIDGTETDVTVYGFFKNNSFHHSVCREPSSDGFLPDEACREAVSCSDIARYETTIGRTDCFTPGAG